MKTKNLFLGLAATVILMSCNLKKTTENKTPRQNKVIKVETQVAKITQPESILEYSGGIIPAVTIPLSFKSMGTVMQIRVDEGDCVQKGQILAEIDKTTLQNSYNAALASQKQVQDAYNRLKTVYNKGSLPEIKWEEIKAKLEHAKSAEQISKRNLENCVLKAPSNGIIGSRNIEVGTNVTPGITVLNLMEIRNVLVKISVPENEIRKIRKNQKAEVTIPAISDKPFDAIVQKIGVSANIVSKTYEVKLRIENSNLTIKPGMVCDVKLDIGAQEKVVAIPFQSVLKEGDKTIVYVVDKQSKTAHKKQVETGSFINNDIEIISGLSVGDEVVTAGQHKLTDNFPVEI